MNNYYTTQGSVRASCGHKHKSIETAYKCLEQEKKDCKSVGGYSDRVIMECDGEDCVVVDINALDKLDMQQY